MKIHASGEDYLEAVLVLQKNHGAVRSIDVARRVGVSKASVSYAVSALREGGFLTVDSDYVLHLTETGRNVAEKIYERHQFFTEQFIVSIETQQMIIARYLEQYPEISVYDTYIDNGATGTNFHRPGFQQMLSDIEAGHVNCVIVKDLSRLGRNTIDTGYYIEQYFRIRSVRFIAVNENFDTAAPEDAHSGIIIPLRNMINEAYALDIGRKIRAQQRQAMKDGKFIGARTPYGYLKAEDDCHQLIIDPVAAVVVQRMFRWASEGAGLNTIAVRLNEAGVLTPSHYKKMQGKITHENLLGSGKWQTRTVGVILRSEVYTGDLVQGQTKTVDHRQVKADAEEWTVVRDTHEAIISREQFAAVQEILNQTASRAKTREVKAFTPNLLKGKVSRRAIF